VRGLHLASEPAAGWLHLAVPGPRSSGSRTRSPAAAR
jgi:hypothetical protein